MKMQLFLLALGIFLCSCFNNQNDKKSKEKETNNLTFKRNENEQIREIVPIDVNFVKHLAQSFSTSTFLKKEQTDIFFHPKENGYFGNYTLFIKDHDSSSNVIFYLGELVIFNDETPWYYSNTTDIFVEVTLFTSHIKLFDCLSVGSPFDDFILFFGEPIHIEDEYFIFSIDSSFFLSVVVSNEKAIRIRCGFYSFEKNETVLYHLTNF